MNIPENVQEGIEVDVQVVRSLAEDKQNVEDRIKKYFIEVSFTFS